MAPGINGGGRPTGTVPKVKSHQETLREYGGTPRRDYSHFSHMSNNLTSLDWQPVSDGVRHPRSRKESNTSVSRFSEPYDTEDNAVSQDNLWYASPQRSTHYMNHSDDDEASQASWAENGRRKSNNLVTMPEKAQVATRLHQIRDYISQTTTMMENLRAAGGQRNMAQHDKLASMLDGLRDSETKLEALVKTLEKYQPSEGDTGQLDINYGGSIATIARDGHRNQSGGSGPKPTSAEIARRNELKQKFEESQRKLMELQEQRESLFALKQKAQEQLKEARAAQMVQLLGCDDPEILDLQHKLDELQAKKQHMDQLVTQFATMNGHQQDLIETSEHDVRDKMAELVAMREQLIQLSALTQVNGVQDSVDKDTGHLPHDKQDNRLSSTLEKYEATERHLQAKSLKLQEAKAKLKQLQSLLATVEELRQSGQPVPESIIQMLNAASSADDRSSTPPSQQDRSEASLYEYSSPVATEKERERIVNSSEREKSQRQSVGSSSGKHTNQQAKAQGKCQPLEELMLKGDLVSTVNEDLQTQLGFSYQDTAGTASAVGAVWRDSRQDTSDERDNEQTPEYSIDERDEDAAASGHFPGSLTNNNSSANKESGLPVNREVANLTVDSMSISGINNTSSSRTSLSQAPHNVWRKQSSGSTGSLPRGMWTPATAQNEQQQQQQHTRQENICRVDELATTQPDSNWIVQQITQLQTQLQQMCGLYKTFFEKQHNCVPSPWLPPPNIAASLGPYCQYIATASQWQQQQLLVHSLNQCCQLIWHQQRELSALKEAVNAIQQPRPPLQVEETRFSPSNQSRGSVDQPSQITDHSNLSRLPHPRQHQALKSSHSAGLYQPNLVPPTTVSSAHSLPNLSSPQTSGQHTITERNTNVDSPTPANCLNIAQENRNVLTSSPTATVLSLPPNLNINSNLNTAQNHNIYFNPNSHFNDPNFVNYYPPYGNNLNFDAFPSPVNFLPPPQNHHDSFLNWPSTNNPQPAPTLNNQVPPGNRANNYWDNFRSYSRQNLLSGSSKSNEGLPQSPNLERSQNLSERTSLSHPPELPAFNLSRKEKLNIQSQHVIENISSHPAEMTSVSTRAQVHHEPANQNTVADVADEPEMNDEASGYQAQNLVRHQTFMPRGNQPVYQHNLIGGQCQANRRQDKCLQSGGVKSRNYSTSQCENTETLPKSNRKTQQRSSSNSYANMYDTLSSENRRIKKHNPVEMTKEAKMCQVNNYQPASEVYTENDMTFTQITRPANTECVPSGVRVKKYSYNEDVQRNCAEGKCPLASDKSVRKKEYKGNTIKESCVRTESNKLQDSIEECVYSEVAALISVNEKRPQFLLQLFKDLRQLNSDSERQAALSSIHSLANRIAQHEDQIETVSEESASNMASGETTTDNSPPQPRNVSAWMQKDMAMCQLPISCAKLDWEVRSILLEMLPFIKSRLSETCTSLLLEALRKLILHLVPSQPPHEHLDGLLEDALLKFHGCRLRDVCDELVTVVAEVLISELTFLRLVNTVHHNSEANGEELNEEVVEDDEEEGAVGGVVESQHHEALTNHGVILHSHPANQIGRRTKSETVSEADLAEADQSRHSDHNGDDEIVVEHVEDVMEETRDEASGISRDKDVTDNSEENKTEAVNWAVEGDHEMGLDEVPTRLNNPTDNSEPDSFNQPASNVHSNTNPVAPSDPGPI